MDQPLLLKRICLLWMFLDNQCSILNATFKAYWEPNNDPIYVHKYSNYPPQVLKELLKTIV